MKPRGTFNAPRTGGPSWSRFRIVVDWESLDALREKADESHQKGTQWVLYLAAAGDYSPLHDHLRATRARLEQTGLLPHVRAVCYSEEWYERAYAGQMAVFAGLITGTDPPIDAHLGVVADAICSFVGAQHALIKRIFPELLTAWLTTLANPNRAYGAFYYRPVPAFTDVLALDAYVPKGQTFATAVDPAYYAAIRTTALPIVSIPQGFRSTDPADMWSAGPTVGDVHHYERWLQHPRVVAQWWFDWQSRPGIDGLDALPEIRTAIDVVASPRLFTRAQGLDAVVGAGAAPVTLATALSLAGVPASRTPGIRR